MKEPLNDNNSNNSVNIFEGAIDQIKSARKTNAAMIDSPYRVANITFNVLSSCVSIGLVSWLSIKFYTAIASAAAEGGIGISQGLIQSFAGGSASINTLIATTGGSALGTPVIILFAGLALYTALSKTKYFEKLTGDDIGLIAGVAQLFRKFSIPEANPFKSGDISERIHFKVNHNANVVSKKMVGGMNIMIKFTEVLHQAIAWINGRKKLGTFLDCTFGIGPLAIVLTALVFPPILPMLPYLLGAAIFLGKIKSVMKFTKIGIELGTIGVNQILNVRPAQQKLNQINSIFNDTTLSVNGKKGRINKIFGEHLGDGGLHSSILEEIVPQCSSGDMFQQAGLAIKNAILLHQIKIDMTGADFVQVIDENKTLNPMHDRGEDQDLVEQYKAINNTLSGQLSKAQIGGARYDTAESFFVELGSVSFVNQNQATSTDLRIDSNSDVRANNLPLNSQLSQNPDPRPVSSPPSSPLSSPDPTRGSMRSGNMYEGSEKTNANQESATKAPGKSI